MHMISLSIACAACLTAAWHVCRKLTAARRENERLGAELERGYAAHMEAVTAMLDTAAPALARDMPDRWRVMRHKVGSPAVVIRDYDYDPADPDDRDYARTCAEELCDMINTDHHIHAAHI